MGRLHAERLRDDGRGCVVAAFDVDRRSADSLCHDLAPDARAFDQFESLLAFDGIDAAILCTPTSLHYCQTLDCLDRGWAVLCEKPLADRRADILELIEREKAGATLAVAYQRRHWSTFRTLRREVLSARWGPVRAVTCHAVENWQQTIGGTWRDDPAINVGGFVGDGGSHKVDAVFYVTGLLPTEVTAHTDQCGSRVEIVATVFGKLQGNVPLAMNFIGNGQYLGEDLHIHCARADLMIRENQLWIGREGRVEPIIDLEPESNPVAGFIDLLSAKSSNIAPPACALPVFDFTRAIQESNRTGREVTIGVPTS